MVQHADIDHTGLTGVGGGAPAAHAASHESGGSDEIDVTGLTGAGGGGGGWTNPITESGASFANLTGESGTWASNGTLIQQTGTGASHKRCHHNTLIPIGAGVVIEVDIRILTAGSGGGADIAAGVLLGHAGSNANGAVSVGLEPNSDTIQTERSGVVALDTMAHTLALDTWYTLRVVSSGGWVSVYLDGTLKGTSYVTGDPAVNADFVGLYAYDAVTDFRNLDVWHVTLP